MTKQIFRIQAIQAGVASRPTFVHAAIGDIIDVETSGPWGSWMRRVPDSLPLINDGKAIYNVKDGVARIIHDGKVIARMTVCKPHELPELIEDEAAQ